MTTHVHDLDGCAPTPLAAYLKGLAVLRLIAEQRDPAARGAWRGDRFVLVTALDAVELEQFFLREYAPTPLLSPWNGGSGFYPKDTKDGIDGIAASAAPRFAAYRDAIAQARTTVGAMSESPKKEEKEAFLRRCRDTWTGPVTHWIDAAYALMPDGSPKYPSLLGTGGNDGRLDFTNNFMQRLIELFDATSGEPVPGAAELLGLALRGDATSGLLSKAVGQFLPGGAGGANQGFGFGGEARVNPWDFVLMLEGALLFEVAVVRRLDGRSLPQAAAPFAMRAQAAGYASAAGGEEAARGEQWFPLWNRPATLSEVHALFAEGRVQLGRSAANRPLDAARALGKLGVARGIDAFERVGFIERNGRSNFAVPLGRWTVPDERRAGIELLDELDEWMRGFRRAAGDNHAPASIGRDLRSLEDAMLDVCREGRGESWRALMIRLGEVEQGLVRRPRAAADLRLQPLPELSVGWWKKAAEGADVDQLAELRLALAIGTQVAPATDLERPLDSRMGPIRVHCMPLDPKSGFRRFRTSEDRLANDPRVVWQGHRLVDDLAAVAMRRLMDGKRLGVRGLPLVGRAPAPLHDVERWLANELDDGRIAALARVAMTLKRTTDVKPARDALARSTSRRGLPLPIIGLFRPLFVPVKPGPKGEPDTHEPIADAALLRLLMSGNMTSAVTRARARLVAGGRRPRVRLIAGSQAEARRIAASVAIPLSRRDIARLLDAVCNPLEEQAEREDAPQNTLEE